MRSPEPAPERWARVKEITSGALERATSQRPSWLEEACAGDETLRQEVESLIAAHERAGGFLETPAVMASAARQSVIAAPPPASPPFASGIGRYRIIRELGQGGMGVVYLAERADATFEKKAAIKVVHGGLASEALKRRFRYERRILATLDHPNIARLLDGGTTREGLPYLVMEYVDGIPVDDYCETPPLPLRPRLALFLQICAAVQYAHEHLVIHRDLKPHNVLVTPEGTPKLLDFGIAKLLEPGTAPQDETRTGLRAFSLEGASPEQVRGEPMAVTSDVYSLGVLLYRLLTGQSPYGPAPRTDAECIRAICEHAPVRPSLAAPIESRRQLRTELDWIVLKALRKEPDRRYTSVEQFRDDVHSYLSGRPVRAAPDSWRYRARKFSLRHRTAVAAAALLVASMLAGLTTTLWQARVARVERARAEQRFGDVRNLANSFLFEFHDAIKDLPGSTPARKLVAAKALAYLDSLAREQAHDPELSLELAIAYQKVGDILGSPFAANLGDTPGAVRSVQKAIDIEEALVRSDPGRRSYQENLAAAYGRMSELHSVAKDETSSLETARRALGIMERLAALHPGDAAIQRELPRHYDRIGDLVSNMGDLEEGLRQYRKAGAVIETVLRDAPQDERALRALMGNYDSIAITLGNPRYPNLDDPAAALVVIQKAVSLSEEKSKSGSATAYKTWFGVGLVNMGEIQAALGDREGALASYRKAVAWWQSLVEADGGDVFRRLFLAFALTELGDALSETGRPVEAHTVLRRAIEMTTRLSQKDPANTQPRAYQAFAHAIYGGILAKHGNDVEALGSYEKSVHLYRALVEKDEMNVQNRLELVAPCLGAGKVHVTRARRASPGESIAHCERALPYLECGTENYAELQRHFRLTRKQSRERDEAAAAIRWCRTPKTTD